MQNNPITRKYPPDPLLPNSGFQSLKVILSKSPPPAPSLRLIFRWLRKQS